MPYLTSFERLAMEEGREKGREEGAREELVATIRTTLKDRFGPTGSRPMSKVRALNELDRLRSIQEGLLKAGSLAEVPELLSFER